MSSGGDFTGLTCERCDDQLASPTILGRCLHDENRYMMIAFAIHLHCALHFPNQLLLHCNRLHVVPIYIKRSGTNTKGSQQTSGCNITSHIVAYLSTNSSPNRAKSTMHEEEAIPYGLSPSERKVPSHRLRILHSSQQKYDQTYHPSWPAGAPHQPESHPQRGDEHW